MSGTERAGVNGTGAGSDPFSQLLYPMVSAQPVAGQVAAAELARAPVEKAAESNRLRELALAEYGHELVAAAAGVAGRARSGGRVLLCGNGGSATTAAEVSALLVAPPPGWRPLPALSLTNDIAVLTGIANDIGFADVFVRQLIALARPHDVLVVVSTSGGSENLVRAVLHCRERGLLTLALCGYDGGRVVREGKPDHALVVRSSSVHRIQEVQVTLFHLLCQLVQRRLREETPCA